MAVTIFRNAAVLDAASGSLTDGLSVAVEDGRIADVGAGLTGPSGAVIVDVGGRTVMPGLIDAHTHPAIVDHDVFGMAEWAPTYVAARASHVLAGMLARGFTSIRDVGAGEIGLARAVEEGYFTGPRLFYGGKQLSQTGGAGDWRAPTRSVYDDNYYSPAIGVICDGVDEARRAVREEVRRGAHHIKVYLSGAVDSPSDRVDSTQFSMDELRAIVEEASARWRLEAVRIVHRVGRIPLGHAVVIVVVAAAHRAAAFDACEFIMDFLKTHAPFWKKEIRHDGVAGWVEPKAHDDQAMRRWG